MTSTALTEALLRNDLDAYWMPFTANRAFKQSPLLLAYAEGMHYFSPDGRAIIGGSAGLWCANAGHCRASAAAWTKRVLLSSGGTMIALRVLLTNE